MCSLQAGSHPSVAYEVMKMPDVEATGSGGSQAEDSEARTQVTGYCARPATAPWHRFE